MVGVEMGGSYMSGIDDGAVSAGHGNRVGELYREMEIVEIVSTGVGSTGIGVPGHISEDIE